MVGEGGTPEHYQHGFEARILMSAPSRAIIDKDIDENGDFEGGPPLRQFPGSVGVVVKAFYLRWNI